MKTDWLETLPSTSPFEVQDWGLIEYEEALRRQLQLVDKVAEKNLKKKWAGFIVFCSHPPIVTLGRKTEPGDVFDWRGPIKEISRGGRATYHGPSQLVVYPIINLDYPTKNRPVRDIGKFLGTFEKAIVTTLSEYKIQSQGKLFEATGVWVGNRKVGSIGVAVKKWVTYHGASLNLDHDPNSFQGLNPCGFSPAVMISVEELLGRTISRKEFQTRLLNHLLINF